MDIIANGSNMATAALEVAKQGILVFPCNQDKRPATRHGFKDATTDHEQIRQWWTENPNALIGVPSGKASGIDVFDVDIQHGGHLSLKVLEHIFRPIPKTRMVRTRSGGTHYQFQANGVRNSNGVLGPGLDVRGEGGYYIIPPTPGYAYLNDAPLAAYPAFLDPKKIILSGGKFNPLAAMKGVNEGSRDTTIFKLASWLRGEGFDRELAEEIVLLAASN
jgi:hypothetical protein